MSVQLINLVVLVAIINGVYSNTPEVQTKKEFRIAVVSKLGGISPRFTFPSYFMGSLIYDSSSQEVEVKLDSPKENEDKNGLPPPEGIPYDQENIILLGGSELTFFNGELYAADHSSGRIYVFENEQFESWTTVLTESNIDKAYEMPISWATARDNVMYVGPSGNEEVNNVAEVRGPQSSTFIDFSEQFNALKKEAEMENGYMTHESCVYSAIHKEFYFLPKKASQNEYDDNADLTNAANILLTMSEDMHKFKKVANILHSTENKDRGYSSFAFVPDTKDEIIVAIQTSDITDSTYITAFTRQGKVLLESIKICSEPLKGLAFLLASKTDG